MSERDWVANETILTGDLNGDGLYPGNSYHVVSAVNTDESAVINGFTITMGNADNPADPYDKHRGAGVFCNGCSAVIRNCTIVNNKAWTGAGVMIWRAGPIAC